MLGSSVVKVTLSSTNGATLDSNPITVTVECPTLVVNTITSSFPFDFRYPATTVVSDVVTLSTAHGTTPT